MSAITKLAGIVTIPKQSVTRLKEIDFIPLSDKKILAIIVTNEAEVENRILEMNRIYSREELNRAANYLNTNFKGRSLVYIKKQIDQRITNDKRISNRDDD